MREAQKQWKALPAYEKGTSNADAEAKTNAAVEHTGEDFKAFLSRTGASGSNTDRDTTSRRRAVATTMQQCINHPIWQAGFQLEAFNNGFRKDLIFAGTNDEVAAKCDVTFGFDDVVADKQKEALKPFIACGYLNDGLCGDNVFAVKGKLLSQNLYTVLKMRKLVDAVPLLLRFALHGGFDMWGFVLKIHGKGDYVLFTAACIDVIDGVGPVALLAGAEADPGQPKLMHLPMMLHSLSRRSEAAHGDFTEADEVKVELHDYKAYHGLDQFAAELVQRFGDLEGIYENLDQVKVSVA